MVWLITTTPAFENSLIALKLYDQNSFYSALLHDLSQRKTEVIIESPFLTMKRTAVLKATLVRLVGMGARVIVNTREPKEGDRATTKQLLH